MTLHEIDKNIEAIIEQGFSVDEETGELLFTAEDIEQLQIDRKEKIENIALVYLNYKALANDIKAQIETFKERKDRIEKKLDNLGKYLDYALQGKKFETAKCSITYRKSSSIEIADGTELPKDYLTVKITETPNKKALTEAIKNGEEIKGVSLVEKNNISIK